VSAVRSTAMWANYGQKIDNYSITGPQVARG